VPKRALVTLIVSLLVGACAPSQRLTFPTSPSREDGNLTWYQTSPAYNGPDFALRGDPATGRVDAVCYDDDRDGAVDRVYRLADYREDRVPHLIILLDSIPFNEVAKRYDAGDFQWFEPPQKVIAPFPSLTEVCYSELMHAPPLPGMTDQYYDPKRGRNNGLLDRAKGYEQPWERRLDYHSDFVEQGLAYLNPRPWHAAEIERVRKTLDDSPDRVTLVYVTSASGMLCKYGKKGCDQVLDDLRQLCLQLLYERQGAIEISVLADHGHNLTESTNIHLDEILHAAGFRPVEKIERDDDVMIEINGLVTYAGIHTRQPAKVADTLLHHTEVELAMYVQGDAVLVRSARGVARVECRDGNVLYRPDTADVLDYAPVIEHLKSTGKLSADGFPSDADWFAATLDHPWPDAPRRIWDAFHGTAVNPPTVMITLHDGYAAGLASFEKMMKIASTHGGLNQINTATFVMSMTKRITHPMRTRDVLQTLEPNYQIPLKR
jgi:hypothetical protein